MTEIIYLADYPERRRKLREALAAVAILRVDEDQLDAEIIPLPVPEPPKEAA